MNSVPEAYRGVWRRTLLRTASGVEDRRTRVLWLQTASVHADLRLPDPLPMTVAGRTRQSGFAGITEVGGDQCQWHRLIDFHPDSGTDVGTMHFVSPDEVHERGLDGSYLEIWQRLPESVGPTHALWLTAAGAPQRQGCLLQAGDCFMFVADRPGPVEQGVPLLSQITGLGADPAEIMLGCELSFGRVAGGSMPWEITLSSLPGRTGRCLLLAPPAGELEQWPEEQLAGLGGYPPANGWQRAPLPQLNMSVQENAP